MRYSAFQPTYAVRPLPDRVDAPENRGYHIEKTGIFLPAVLQGTAPISWRIRGNSPEHTNRQVLAFQLPLGNPRWYDGSDTPIRRQQANRKLLSPGIRDVSGRIPMSVSWLAPKAPRRNSGGWLSATAMKRRVLGTQTQSRPTSSIRTPSRIPWFHGSAVGKGDKVGGTKANETAVATGKARVGGGI